MMTSGHPKNWLAGMFLMLGLIWASLIAPILIIDPLTQFSSPTEGDRRYYDKIRFSGPGIAKNLDFEILIAGASAARAYQARVAEEATGQRVINLAIDGGTAYEQRLMVQAALREKPSILVIWQQTWLSHKWDVGETRLGLSAFPDYLYAQGTIPLLRYLTNPLYTKMALDLFLNKNLGAYTSHIGQQPLVYQNDDDLGSYLQTVTIAEAVAEVAAHPISKTPSFDEETFAAKFHANVRSVVTTHPDARFVFIEPRYADIASEIFRGAFSDADLYATALSASLKELAHNFDNVVYLNLDDLVRFRTSVEFYKDLTHLKQRYSDEVFQTIIERSKVFWANG